MSSCAIYENKDTLLLIQPRHAVAMVQESDSSRGKKSIALHSLMYRATKEELCAQQDVWKKIGTLIERNTFSISASVFRAFILRCPFADVVQDTCLAVLPVVVEVLNGERAEELGRDQHFDCMVSAVSAAFVLQKDIKWQVNSWLTIKSQKKIPTGVEEFLRSYVSGTLETVDIH